MCCCRRPQYSSKLLRQGSARVATHSVHRLPTHAPYRAHWAPSRRTRGGPILSGPRLKRSKLMAAVLDLGRTSGGGSRNEASTM